MHRARYARAARAIALAVFSLAWPRLASPQATPHVPVLTKGSDSYDSAADAARAFEARRTIARQFYRNHGDNYDFLVVFPAFQVDLGKDVLGLHHLIRNDVQGIGMPILDAGRDYGSSRRLKAYIDVGALVPGSPFATVPDSLGVVAHEIAHQWSGSVEYIDSLTGAYRSDLLGRDGAHWSFFLDSDGSVLYGSDWQDRGDGTFAAVESRKRYSDLDLYLMGLIAPGTVRPLDLLEPVPPTPFSATDLPPPEGTLVAATRGQVTIEQIIAAEGPRASQAQSGQNVFRAAFAILVPDGTSPTAEQIAFVDQVRRAWANEFFFMTRGLAMMETDLVEVPPGEVESNPSVESGLAYLLAAQRPDGRWADAERTALRDTQAAVEALALFRTDTRSGTALQRAAGWLTPLRPSDVDGVARRTLALSTAGLAPPAGDASLALLRTGTGGGIGMRQRFAPDVLDTALAGVALAAAGEWRGDVADWLLANQNPDGGWPYAPGGPSRIEPTVRAAQHLYEMRSEWRAASAVGLALQWMNARMQPDGTFADDESGRPSATALVAEAFGLWNGYVYSGNAVLKQQRPDGSWHGSAYQTAEALKVLRTSAAPNFRIVPEATFLSASTVTEGEWVNATVGVAGVPKALDGVTLRAFDEAGVPFGPAVGVPGTESAFSSVSMLLDTRGHAGSVVYLVVDPDGVFVEANEIDNRLGVPLEIRPPPDVPELFVVAGSLVHAPEEISRLPGQIDVTAIVGNAGNVAAGAVEVALLVNGEVGASTTVELGPRELKPVTLTAAVTRASVDVPIAIVVDPAGRIAEANESNNALSDRVPVVPSVRLAVVDPIAVPNPVDPGADVELRYTLRNGGTSDASASVEIAVTMPGGAPVATLATQTHAVSAGTVVPLSARWRADRVGPLIARIHVRHPLDADPTDDEAMVSFTVNESGPPNLAVEYGSFRSSPSPLLERRAGTLSVGVANRGASDSGPFSVAFYEGDPAQGLLLHEVQIPQLAPGATETVQALYTPATSATMALAVRVDSRSQVAEFDETDNDAVLTVKPLSFPDLVLGDDDLLTSNRYPKTGDVVALRASVYNAGDQPSQPTKVELFLGGESGTLLGEASLPAIPGRSRAEASFTWNTAGFSGVQQVVAIVNRSGFAEEARADNNQAVRTFNLQDGPVAIANQFFSPNGDGIKDTAEVYVRLEHPAAVEARVVSGSGERVRTLSAAQGVEPVAVLTWDGKADDGRYAPDGRYQITVVSTAGGVETWVGAATAVLDLNRQPLHEAREADLLLTEVDRGMPYYPRDGVRAAPDDSGWYTYVSPQWGSSPYSSPENPCGLHFQPRSGPAVRLQPDGSICESVGYFDVSPDRTLLAYVPGEQGTYDYWTKPKVGPDLKLLDLTTGDARILARSSVGSWWVMPGAVTFSSDAKRVFFMRGDVYEFCENWLFCDYRWHAEQASSVGMDGLQRRELLAPYWYGYWDAASRQEYHLSTDEQSIAFEVATSSTYWWPPEYNYGLTAAPVGTGTGIGRTVRAGERVTGFSWLGGGSAAIAEVGDDLAIIDPFDDTAPARKVTLPQGVWGWVVSPVGDALVYQTQNNEARSAALYLARPADGRGVSLGDFPAQWVSALQWMRGGSYVEIAYRAPDEWEDRFLELTNSANLGASIRGSRPFGSTALSFVGTANDANFEWYEVAVRPFGSKALPTVVKRSSDPVQRGLLAQWSPPSPGVYEAFLTVYDKAGNQITRRARASWSLAPPIADLDAVPRYVSPNGDGIQDSTLVTYRAVEPLTTEFTVTGMGKLVRRIDRTHLQPEAGSFVWDGRNDAGEVVGDGLYTVGAEGVSVPVIVDATPPGVTLALIKDEPHADDLRTFAGRRNSADMVAESHCGPFMPNEGPIATTYKWITAHASDQNLLESVLEGAAPGSSRYEPIGAAESIGYPFIAIGDEAFRVRAADRAGNTNAAEADLRLERLFVVGIGYGEYLEPDMGQCQSGGRSFPRVDLLDPIFNDVSLETASGSQYFSVLNLPASQPFEPIKYGLAIASTIQEPIVSYAVEYSTPEGVPILDRENVRMISPRAITWDATSLPVDLHGMTLTVMATDATGRVFSDHVYFSRFASLSACTSVRPDPAYPERLSERLTVNVTQDYVPDDPIEEAHLEFRVPNSGRPPVLTLSVQEGFSNIPVRDLPECTYELRYDARSQAGRTYAAKGVVHLCGVHVVRPGGEGTPLIVRDQQDIRFGIAQSYRAPASSIDVALEKKVWDPVTKTQTYEWVAAGTFAAPAREQVTMLKVPWSDCELPSGIRFTTRLADGRTLVSHYGQPQTGDDSELSSCDGLPHPACIEGTLALVPSGGYAPTCGSNPPQYAAHLRARVSGEERLVGVASGLYVARTGLYLADFPIPFEPGAEIDAVVPIELARIPEGTFTLGATVRASNGDSLGLRSVYHEVRTPGGAVVLLPGGEFTVDRTPPLFGITAPQDGAAVCPKNTLGASWAYVVEGFVQDAYLTSMTVNVASVERPEQTRSLMVPAAGTFALPFDASGFSAGTYEITGDVRDASGTSYCLAPRRFTVYDTLQVDMARTAPRLFSPDVPGDGVLDEATVSFEVNAPANMDAKLVTPTEPGEPPGPVYDVYQGEHAQGPGEIVLNGRTIGGGRIPDGRYGLVLTGVDGCGTKDTASDGPIEIDTTPPEVRIDAPAGGATVSSIVAIRGEVSDLHFDAYEVSVGEGLSPVEWTRLASDTHPKTGVLATVSLGDRTPGDYTIRVSASDTVGHLQERFVRVKVAPSSLIRSLSVTPDLFSPNGDGRRETSTVAFTVNADVLGTLEIVRAGVPIATPIPGEMMALGPHAYVIDASTVAGILDGNYAVRLTATLLDYIESAEVELTLDRAPPSISLSEPASGSWVAGTAWVRGSIGNANDEGRGGTWSLQLESGGTSRAIATGTVPDAGGLAVVDGLPDGEHVLVLSARDGAENEGQSLVRFASDSTPPQVVFASPLAGAWLADALVPVTVRVVEEHPRLGRLTVTNAAGTRELAKVETFPGGELHAEWAPDQDQDGPAKLVAKVTDLAGNTTTRELDVFVDRAPPVAHITSPRDGYLGNPPVFTGTADDANLSEWTLEFAPGVPGVAFDFAPIASGTAASTGELGRLGALPADGTYTARLTVVDRAGNRSEDLVAFVVDTSPPTPPLDLAVAPGAPREAVLTWTASADPGVTGYVVQRAAGDGALLPVTSSPVTGTRYVDGSLADGRYRWVVVAVDSTGRWSGPSNEVALAIDLTAPAVSIASPSQGSRVGGTVEITGSAYAPSDFKVYRLSVGAGTVPAELRVFASSTAPVQFGALGKLDSTVLDDGAQTIQLEAEDVLGNVAQVRRQLVVDNSPPAAPVLLSAAPSGSGVALSWQASSEPDVAGYLLYRNGVLAGVPDGADLSDLGAWLVKGLAQTDANVPDGTWTYQVQALDTAGNASPLSNALTVSLDRRAPSAEIVDPVHLARLEQGQFVIAEVADIDVVQVQIEARAAGEPTFRPLGTLVRPPFAAWLDPEAFGADVIEVRAVASDAAGNVDPAPRSAFLLFGPDPTVPSVHPLLDGLAVSVGWAPADAAGYEVRRDGNLLTSATRPEGTASASSTGSGTPDGAYGTWGGWGAGGTAPQWWRVDLLTPTLIERVQASGWGATSVDLKVKVHGAWIPVARGQPAWLDVVIDPPLLAEAVEYDVVADSGMPARLYSVDIAPVQATPGPPVADSLFATGSYVYSVKAFSPFGRSVEASGVAVAYQATIDAVPSAVATPTGRLAGTVAAGAMVEIAHAAGGAPIATARSDAQGRFAVDVSLAAGANAFVATGVEDGGSRSIPSAPASITYAPPPAAQVTLQVSAISGADVSLAYSVTGDPTGVSSFALERRDGAGVLVTRSLAASARAYVDVGVQNGTYRYVVVPLNSGGIGGTPSNEVTATVDVSPPLAPEQLAAFAPPSGGQVALAWTWAGTGQVRFALERALAEAGPFAALAQVNGVTYGDLAVQNGTTYHYRVLAVDAHGNRSASSNVATATPRRIRDMAAPRITYPTVPGEAITVAEFTADIGGLSEEGATVELRRNGFVVGTTVAGPAVLEKRWPSLAHWPSGASDFDAAGRIVAYEYWPSNGNPQSVAIEDLDTGEVWTLGAPGLRFTGSDIAISPDGNRFAAAAWSTADWSRRLYVGDRRTGTLVAVGEPQSSPPFQPTWSPDSAWVAFQRMSGTRVVVVAAAADGSATRDIADTGDVMSPVWCGTGTLAVRVMAPDYWAHPAAITLVDVASGSRTEAYRAFDARPLAASADGKWLAFAGRDVVTSLYDIHVIEPASGGGAVLLSASNSLDGIAAFSPDGSRLAFIESGSLVVQDVPVGDRVQPGYVQDPIRWTARGVVVLPGWSQPYFADWGGPFEFPSVPLLPGANVFAAVARDVSGNESPQSDAIQVILDAGVAPDLELTASVQPTTPIAGGPANAILVVRNRGGSRSDAVLLGATLRLPDGRTRSLGPLPLAPIDAGRATTVPLALDLAGVSGHVQLVATVDPARVGRDTDRSNDSAEIGFDVIAAASLAVLAAVSPPSIGANETATATVDVVNPGAPRTLVVRIGLEDAVGALVASLGPEERLDPIATGTRRSFTREVPSSDLVPGDYRVFAELVEGGAAVARTTAPLEIATDVNVALTVSPSCASCFSGEPLTIGSRVENRSANSALDDLTWRLDVADASEAVVASASVILAPLPRDALATPSAELPALPPGSYQARVSVWRQGASIASAAAPFTVAGRPLVAGTLAVEGASGDLPVVRAGATVNLRWTVSNPGGATAAGVVAALRILDPSNGALLREDVQLLGDLAPAAQSGGVTSIATGSLPLGIHAVTLVASASGVPEQSLASVRFRLADGAPPELSVLNLADGMFVRGSVAPRVQARDAGSGTTGVWVLPGGAEMPLALSSGSAVDGIWSGTVVLSPDGAHELVFHAADAEGNDGLQTPAATNPIHLSVVSDTISPEVTILGVEDGALVSTVVVPRVVATDLNLASVSATLDASPLVPGTAVSDDGVHVVLAEAIDRAGNAASAVLRFEVDRSPPVIAVLGGIDGGCSRGPVTPVIVVTDANLRDWDARLDGSPFVAGAAVDEERAHVLDVTARDLAGNEASEQVSFVLDRTDPEVWVFGVAAGAIVRGPITISFGALDANLVSSEAQLDGARMPAGSSVATEGAHVLAVTAFDCAGNRTERKVPFRIDDTPPLIRLAGIDRQYLNGDVAPTFEVTDSNLASVDALLDGAPFASGTTVTAAGPHELAVRAVDLAGNEATAKATFTIDRTPPSIAIAGVAPDAYVPGPVTLSVTIEDPNLGATSISLDAEAYVPGTTIRAEGLHLLRVTATDLAANEAIRTLAFTIDATPPAIAIDGVAEGEVRGSDVVPVVSVRDTNLATFTVRADGIELPAGGAVTDEGPHVLAVDAVDLAGNRASREVSFEIDKTPPVLFASVEDGRTYPSPVAVEFGATDRTLASVEAVLDGASFASGSAVTQPGEHVLVLTARDRADHSTTRTIRFSVEAAVNRFAVTRSLAGNGTRILGWVTDGCRAEGEGVAGLRAFVEGALPSDATISYAGDVDAFRAGLRSGAYGVYLIGVVGPPDAANAPPPSKAGEACQRLDPLVEAELTEAVFRGAGLVLVKDHPSEDPDVREALGARFVGREQDGRVALEASAFTDGAQLDTKGGVGLASEGAHAIGRWSGGDLAVTAYPFGVGEAIVVGMDPARAAPENVARASVRGALAFVAPDGAPAPLGTVIVRIDVESLGGQADIRVEERLGARLSLVEIFDGGTEEPEDTIRWLRTVAAGERQAFRYQARLPSSAGRFETSATLTVLDPSGDRSYGTFPFEIVLEQGAAELSAATFALAEALPENGANANLREKILARLSSVAANAGVTTADRERAIADLLAAVDLLRQVQGVDRAPLRYAISRLLGFWEAR